MEEIMRFQITEAEAREMAKLEEVYRSSKRTVWECDVFRGN
jgi:hypothetical protein